ncbi:2-oxoglutarate and Fe(II)-dependent oxygenase superfamily protein [Prunus dulcis]|uniref:2-oxoglutarate and Fe(II)-dependent oxygenase superfamily protein n=1 Tax=Prunus dulcis TaxID=3755 RepID=A0A4Y1RYL4_PRUDU|nr:2-oxoglutarate and Fe(II)-dependent oxygenase superfamily protein [Prunus dulcis]
MKLFLQKVQIKTTELLYLPNQKSPAMGEVDPAFIQDPEHRPKLSIIEAEGIPLIDLSPINSIPTPDSISELKAIEGLVTEIGSACKNWGFFQVINHGVALDKREKIETAARKFFAQPLEEKRKIRRDEKIVVGYYDTEHTKNVRDWKEVFDFVVEEPTLVPASLDPEDKEETEWINQWPENPPELRLVCEEYAREVEKLALKLMGLIALSLGLPEDRFNSYFKDQTSFIRLNHYPPCPSPRLALGVGRHKDGGALTVLAQDDVGGLEVKRKTDGEWIRVKPTPNAYIINVGDVIQVWSNERFESVEHRVMVNSEKERFSIPFFLNPAHYTQVKPLEELIDERNPAKYKPYSWGKFITHRKLSNFKKLNTENIQIYHFRYNLERATA